MKTFLISIIILCIGVSGIASEFPGKAIIVSYYNKSVIDLPRLTTQNAAVISIWSYNGQLNQHWIIEKTEKGYIISSDWSRQCLTANPIDSSIIQQPFTGDKYQYWNLQSSNDSVKIFNPATNSYISIKTSGDLKLIKSNRSITQVWKILDINSNGVEVSNFIYGHLNVLKRSTGYDLNDSRKIPEFTYQHMERPELKSLRQRFNLDSVAGTGNEVSKILNLMHWLHNLVPHDGQNSNPEILNAEYMISLCKKEKRGLNCRGLAMTLNECYLSLGFKSRYVTCLPKDSLKFDRECHVINMVYSDDLKKWLWVDPTHDVYVMNEKGELLSIEEVRERIITNKPLIINPDANWNHKVSTLKDYYLYNYMAKNLYRFQCLVNSIYNAETIEKDKSFVYIDLLPLDYPDQKPDKVEYNNDMYNTKYVYYKCNNPNVFWQVPDKL